MIHVLQRRPRSAGPVAILGGRLGMLLGRLSGGLANTRAALAAGAASALLAGCSSTPLDAPIENTPSAPSTSSTPFSSSAPSESAPANAGTVLLRGKARWVPV